MTSSSSGGVRARHRTAGLRQRRLELCEELIRAETQPEQGKPQHQVTAQCDRVLAKGIGHDLLDPRVLDPVDLEDHGPAVPPEVEVVRPARRTTEQVLVRLGEAPLATPAEQVELPERADTPGEVEQEYVQQATTAITTYAQHLHGQLLDLRQPLLDGHGEHERRLTVRRGPERRPDCGDSGSCARQPLLHDVVRLPSPRLPDVANGPSVPNPCSTRDRDPDLARFVVLQARDDQGRLAVQERTRPAFECGRPPTRVRGEGTGPHQDTVRSEPPPSPRADVCSYLAPSEACVVQLGAREDARLFLSQLHRSSSASKPPRRAHIHAHPGTLAQIA